MIRRVCLSHNPLSSAPPPWCSWTKCASFRVTSLATSVYIVLVIREPSIEDYVLQSSIYCTAWINPIFTFWMIYVRSNAVVALTATHFRVSTVSQKTNHPVRLGEISLPAVVSRLSAGQRPALPLSLYLDCVHSPLRTILQLTTEKKTGYFRTRNLENRRKSTLQQHLRQKIHRNTQYRGKITQSTTWTSYHVHIFYSNFKKY